MGFSKSEIDKAGKLLAMETFSSEDDWLRFEEIFDDFRQRHLQPLTMTTIELQTWLKSDGLSYIIVQRLKRKPQILKKLRRFKVRLTQLQDIGGLRIIVEQNKDVDTLCDYLNRMVKTQDSIQIKKITDYRQKGRDDSGYRAMHIILERDGILLELQIRSRIQHYWAELTERTSVIYGHVLKELEGSKVVIDYFKKLSNVFYIIETGQTLDISIKIDLEKSRRDAENVIDESDTKKILTGYINEGIVKTLVDKEARLTGDSFHNWVFIFDWNQGVFVDWKDVSLNSNEANKSYVEYENLYPAERGFEVVLVGTSSVAKVRETHSHYFGLAQQDKLLETLDESIVGFSNQMDLDIGARQILAILNRRQFWGRKSISVETLKNHFCKDVFTFDSSLDAIKEKGLLNIYKNGSISLNVKKKKNIETYLT